MSLLDRAIARTLPAIPKSVVRRVSAPYIAGETLADACRVVAELDAAGKKATVDVLGEEIHDTDEARAIAAAYHEALRELDRRGLDGNVSIKLTAFGLQLDHALCRELVTGLVADARSRNAFVRLDMEDATTTDETLELYRHLRADGHDNVGVVLQAYLRRTARDIDELAALRPRVRICKGIYVEPRSIAYTDDDEIRRSFLGALDALLDAGCHVAIATHDEWLLERALDRVAGLDADAYEFQMLLGVRPRRGTEIAAEHPFRVYVPYGARWYEYSLRRLQENPAVAGHVTRDVVRRVFRR